MKKAFTIIEIMLVVSIIALFAAIIVPVLTMDTEPIDEYRKSQIVSTDEQGNELWRTFDNGRFIYYMPNGETSWDGGGKGSNPMGVK